MRDSGLKKSAGCRTSSRDDGIVEPFWGPSVPGAVLPYMGYIGSSAAVKGMVFKQFGSKI